MNRLKVITLKISALPYKAFVDCILQNAISFKSSYVCVANVHMAIEAYRDRDFDIIVDNADLVTPDGMPISKAIKLLYGINQERVAGMDLLPELLRQAELNNLVVFFYGGTSEMLDLTKEYINLNYPNIDKHYYHSPPFRELNSFENKQVVDMINTVNPNIVFVALGCPKQEKWMASMRGQIKACMVGIGGALPVMIGLQKRAPKWIQKMSLEWFYRLIQEPKRLFKRYLFTNSYFIVLLSKQILIVKISLFIRKINKKKF